MIKLPDPQLTVPPKTCKAEQLRLLMYPEQGILAASDIDDYNSSASQTHVHQESHLVPL